MNIFDNIILEKLTYEQGVLPLVFRFFVMIYRRYVWLRPLLDYLNQTEESHDAPIFTENDGGFVIGISHVIVDSVYFYSSQRG